MPLAWGSASCDVSCFPQMYGPTRKCTAGASHAIVFQYSRPAAVVFGGGTAGTADTPMDCLDSLGAYEVIWFS